MSRLRRLLEPVGERYQLCFIDTPPKVEGLSRHVLNVQCAPGGTGGPAPHGAEHLFVTG
jgi:hypothetical protein